MEDKIFICYRRDDSAGIAGRMFDRLTQYFPCVFLDVSSIRLGENFVEQIENRIVDCSIVLAVLGERWESMTVAKQEHGEADDFVILELEMAFRFNVPIIPVLVEGIEMPRSDALPKGIQKLRELNAFRINHESFERDIHELAERVGEYVGQRPVSSEQRKDMWKWGVGFLATAVFEVLTISTQSGADFWSAFNFMVTIPIVTIVLALIHPIEARWGGGLTILFHAAGILILAIIMQLHSMSGIGLDPGGLPVIIMYMVTNALVVAAICKREHKQKTRGTDCG